MEEPEHEKAESKNKNGGSGGGGNQKESGAGSAGETSCTPNGEASCWFNVTREVGDKERGVCVTERGGVSTSDHLNENTK